MIIGLISVQGVLNYLTVMQEREESQFLLTKNINFYLFSPFGIGRLHISIWQRFHFACFLLSQPEA